VVHGVRVDYRELAANRSALDRIVDELGRVGESEESGWPRMDRFAFWINAYNLLTLRSIVDHYPIRGSWFSRGPRNSIRQIDGVWTKTKWRVAGRQVTLDDIEHRILRPQFADPRVHMAINCASEGCPPLRSEAYVGAALDRQLDEAARRYLADEHGARVSGGKLLVSSIFDWYGSDFAAAGGDAAAGVRAFVARYGPPEIAAVAKSAAPLSFLPYDWSLNDVR
jgi:hypothetical protein